MLFVVIVTTPRDTYVFGDFTTQAAAILWGDHYISSEPTRKAWTFTVRGVLHRTDLPIV